MLESWYSLYSRKTSLIESGRCKIWLINSHWELLKAVLYVRWLWANTKQIFLNLRVVPIIEALFRKTPPSKDLTPDQSHQRQECYENVLYKTWQRSNWWRNNDSTRANFVDNHVVFLLAALMTLSPWSTNKQHKQQRSTTNKNANRTLRWWWK